MCRLSSNLVASTSWKPDDLSRPVMGFLYICAYVGCHYIFGNRNNFPQNGINILSLTITVCTAKWSLYVPPVYHSTIVRPNHNVCIYFEFIWEQTELCPLLRKVVSFCIIDLTLYDQVVSICTTTLTFQNSSFCPHCIYLFCIYSRIVTCASYSKNWLVFIRLI